MARLPVPGPVVIPNCAEIKLMWNFDGQSGSNVFHGNLTAAGPLNPGVAETIFSAIKANAGTTAWLGLVHTGVEFTSVEVKDLRAPNNPSHLSSGAAAPGTAAGAPISNGSSICVTLKTAQAGKGFTGRAYLAGLTTASLANGRTIAPASSTAAIAFVNGVNAATTASGLPLVVAQRALQAGTTASGAALPARPAAVVPITSVVVSDTRIDSQRRRLGR